MSLRLRLEGDSWVALCAAEHEARPGDVYLDDGQHYALTEKYLREWQESGLIPPPRKYDGMAQCDCSPCTQARYARGDYD